VEGELFTFGSGLYGKLGHGGTQDALVPRLVAALAGKKVLGAAAGERHTDRCEHTAAWTEEGELFTLSLGMEIMAHSWEAGHGGQQKEAVPRLVEALAVW